MSSSSIQNKHQLFEIAASQYGLFTAKQAIEAGFKNLNIASDLSPKGAILI